MIGELDRCIEVPKRQGAARNQLSWTMDGSRVAKAIFGLDRVSKGPPGYAKRERRGFAIICEGARLGRGGVIERREVSGVKSSCFWQAGCIPLALSLRYNRVGDEIRADSGEGCNHRHVVLRHAHLQLSANACGIELVKLQSGP